MFVPEVVGDFVEARGRGRDEPRQLDDAVVRSQRGKLVLRGVERQHEVAISRCGGVGVGVVGSVVVVDDGSELEAEGNVKALYNHIIKQKQ